VQRMSGRLLRGVIWHGFVHSLWQRQRGRHTSDHLYALRRRAVREWQQ
jgi:hypothetical protein